MASKWPAHAASKKAHPHNYRQGLAKGNSIEWLPFGHLGDTSEIVVLVSYDTPIALRVRNVLFYSTHKYSKSTSCQLSKWRNKQLGEVTLVPVAYEKFFVYVCMGEWPLAGDCVPVAYSPMVRQMASQLRAGFPAGHVPHTRSRGKIMV